MLQNKNKIMVAGFVALIIILMAFFVDKNMKEGGEYSVVYLTTGEIYIGKLKTFPKFELTDSYILQVVADSKDSTKNTFQIQPLEKVLWSPQTLHLIKDNVIFYGLISPDSEIAKTLAGQGQ